MVYNLCRKHTNLSDNDILSIEDIAKSIKIMADIYESDIFIDVLTKDRDEAVVVAHGIPGTVKSLYNKKIVGQKALKKNEPGVLRTLETGISVKDIKALTQENKFVNQRVHPIMNDTGTIGAVIVEKDLTSERNDMETIIKALGVKEAHHRVKNSLQTIAAILRSQSRRCNSIEAKECLRDGVNRVMAVAAIHELLSKATDNNVKVKSAIELLIANINKEFKIHKNIDISIEGEEFEVQSDKVTAILLIINELIQNCYDHGFSNREDGYIRIVIHNDNKQKSIEVIDNGEGFNLKEYDESGLGMYIVKTYVTEILKGIIDVTSSKVGTKVIFKFIIE